MPKAQADTTTAPEKVSARATKPTVSKTNATKATNGTAAVAKPPARQKAATVAKTAKKAPSSETKQEEAASVEAPVTPKAKAEPANLRPGAKELHERVMGHVTEHLVARKMSRKALASQLGTSASYITQLFKGQRLVNIELLHRMGEAFGTEVEIGLKAPVLPKTRTTAPRKAKVENAAAAKTSASVKAVTKAPAKPKATASASTAATKAAAATATEAPAIPEKLAKELKRIKNEKAEKLDKVDKKDKKVKKDKKSK